MFAPKWNAIWSHRRYFFFVKGLYSAPHVVFVPDPSIICSEQECNLLMWMTCSEQMPPNSNCLPLTFLIDHWKLHALVSASGLSILFKHHLNSASPIILKNSITAQNYPKNWTLVSIWGNRPTTVMPVIYARQTLSRSQTDFMRATVVSTLEVTFPASGALNRTWWQWCSAHLWHFHLVQDTFGTFRRIIRKWQTSELSLFGVT